ncbi:protein SERAC1 [Cladorrhinum samala]|uniref:Protein SERAC1 n=1 Tax=Cladorrhinum samala TaxID=585594 RepID=A0AAV9HKT0_9PEZI|nr:protein SERAC1 [Cladorrhinum samala]
MDAATIEANRENAKRGVLGLHVVFDPPHKQQPGDGATDEITDFVFVHGLNGHCWETWRNADNSSSKSKWRKGAGEGVFWPVDLLPGKIENARIMTYQYESKVLCNKSTGSLSDTAGQLVRLLQEARAILGSRGPVVFVVHSLGGIVAKKVITMANDKNNKDWHDIGAATTGIVFFGTPHRGSDVANMVGPVQKITAVGWTMSRFLPLLKSHSDGLREVSDEFRHVAAKYTLVSFYEQHIHPGLREAVVDKSSARMGIPHEKTMMMGGDHSTMCKFSLNDPRFNTAWMAIQSATKAPPVRSDPQA